MPLLYKYYSNESDYAFKNLENGHICFTSLQSLNDPFEGIGKYSFDVSSEEQRYWDSIGSDLPKLLSKRISDDYWELLNFKYRIFCTTTESNNPLLWSYYANSHKGFCVGYNESDILKVADVVSDVRYRNDMCLLNDFNESRNENQYIELLSIKSTEWSREKERRAFYMIKENDISTISVEDYFKKKQCDNDSIYIFRGHAQTNNLQVLSSKKFILKECKPSELYLGMRTSWEDKNRLIEISRKLNIRVYQMYLEQNSFRILFQEVKI